jgi:hypothetical protein
MKTSVYDLYMFLREVPVAPCTAGPLAAGQLQGDRIPAHGMVHSANPPSDVHAT